MQKIFETARMILRELTTEDLSNLMGIFSDPIAMRYYPSTKTEEEVRELIQRHMSNYRVYGFSLWAVMLKENNQFAGLVGLDQTSKEKERLR